MNKNKNDKGFTLIELLVVISIIGVLSSVVLTSLAEARGRARDAKWLTELKQIQTALALYKDDTGSYPSGSTRTQQEFKSVLGSLVPKYFNEVPVSANSIIPYHLMYLSCDEADCSSLGYSEEGYVILFTMESLEPNIKPWPGSLDWYLVGSPN